MFETSVVRAGAIAAPHRGGVLTVSVVFHSFVAAAAVAMSIQSGSFPPDAPRQMAAFMPVAPLPPLPKGNPDAPRNPAPKPPAAQPQQQHAQTAPPQLQDVTPNTIPNNVPQVSGSDTASPATGSGNSSEPWGVKDGDPNGVDIGQPEVPQLPATAPAGPLMPVGDVHAARVLSRVDPKYPNIALTHRIGGVVKVHCIIDKNGNLSDPEIVSSSFPAFNQSVIDALQRWTFAPGTLHGNPVDTYFELTITFAPR